MAHDPRRIVSGFVDYIGLARLALLPATESGITDAAGAIGAEAVGKPPVLAVLRVGLIVADDDLQIFAPILENMIIAVDGISFRVKAYVAEPSNEKTNRTGLTLSCVTIDLGDVTDTTFDKPFENRIVNVELTDTRLIGTRFVGARYNGKPTVESMHGANGGGTGQVSDMMGYGTLSRPARFKHVQASNVDQWHLKVTYQEWPREPPWHVYDTILVNGMAATIARVLSPSECEVVIPPKLRATTTLVTLKPEDTLSVNIEISSLAHALATAKTFRSQTSTDEHFMRLAMNEGDRGRTTSGPNAWTGAVLVDNATRLVIGAASCNSVNGAHAEVACIEQARDAWPARFARDKDDLYSSSDEEGEKDDDGGDGGDATNDDSNDDADDDDGNNEGASTEETNSDALTYGMTLYVTHTPCAHRCASNGDAIPACVPLLGNYNHVLRRVVIGIADAVSGPDDLNYLKIALPDAVVHVMPDRTDLSNELRWTLREYTHWRKTKMPYTTALLVKTLNGYPISRSIKELQDQMAPFTDALRTLAQAVIVDGDTLVRSPTVFEGLSPHEGIQLVARVPKPSNKKGKKHNRQRPMKTQVVKQPFPLRVICVTPPLAKVTPEDRAKWLPKTDALGSVTIFTTMKLIAHDVIAHKDVLGPDPLRELEKNGVDDKDALQNLFNLMWPSHPHLQVTSPYASTDCPDPVSVFKDLGTRGVVTAFVEGTDSFVHTLMDHGLVHEILVVVVDVLAPPWVPPPPPVTVSTDPGRGTNRLTLIACGQVGETNLSSVHYLVTHVPPPPPHAALDVSTGVATSSSSSPESQSNESR